MTAKDDDSEMLKEMFEEIIKMIYSRQIKIEALIQIMTEQDKISQETFDRIYRLLSEHGKMKKWI